MPLPKIYPVACHTDNVGPGSMFVAIPGMKTDGSLFIPEALEKGACVIVIQESQLPLFQKNRDLVSQHKARTYLVANSRKALAKNAALALGNPVQKLKVIGITGTKGKTTTTYILEHMLKTAGYKTARLSTAGNRILDEELPAPLTTPQPDYLHVFFHECVRRGVEWVVMEVAAQALSLYRVEGIQFESILFTNIGHEHGEFYYSPEAYFKAKKKLFDHRKPNAVAFLNADDARVAACKARYADVCLFGFQGIAQEKGTLLSNSSEGVVVFYKNTTLHAPALLGKYNASNILGAAAVASSLGIAPDMVAHACTSFSGVPGRLQRYVLPNKACAVIDYAHNPSSVEAVLSTLSALTDHLIVITGAGGDRDREKRPIMGAIAARIAHQVIFTSDNPRSEDPATIIQAMMQGVSPEDYGKVRQILDREEAIRAAHTLSREKSIIAILGKGPDEYQEVQGMRHFFSERKIIESLQ